MAELPPDIPLFHILPRLPAKTLLRFMCVCKRWHWFLKTPKFPKMHLHNIIDDHHKLLVLSTRRPWKFRTINYEAPKDGLTADRPLPFGANCQEVAIITSLNGLVCIGTIKSKSDIEYMDLILWNPLTGEYKRLFKPSSQKKCYMMDRTSIGLYYNSFDDEYKLVLVTNYGNAYIYSLKSNSWRKIESTLSMVSARLEPGALLNEKLYFLKQLSEGPIAYSIVRFDMKTEKFKEIKTPIESLPSFCMNFTIVRGCIHFFIVVVTNQFELWRMDGDENWTKVVTYHSNACEWPLQLMSNENWLMHSKADDKNEGCIYKLDPVKHTKETICLYAPRSLEIPLRGIYVETFMSPNQYTK